MEKRPGAAAVSLRASVLNLFGAREHSRIPDVSTYTLTLITFADRVYSNGGAGSMTPWCVQWEFMTE